ncbi:MAG TPA: APC family permease [Polyangiaceae bacterium]|nr:APC family permease [Polyangiaceae bacterium]
MNWKTLLLGPRLATHDETTERVTAVAGVAILGLDALASAAYGPEALLTVLIGLGAGATGPLLPLTGCIVVLLVLVCVSYVQTIGAYPNGGGSYTVAKENLGERWGLVAAAALALDYLLNVAVAISAGVGAFVSAVPSMLPYTLPLCLAVLLLLTLVNLRGIRASGLLFTTPTYLFVAALGGVLVLGIAKTFGAHGHPTAVVAPPPAAVVLPGAGLWLLLRAFASGCTAMTGVEAVSNGVPIFRDPRQRRAERTLVAIIALLVGLLGGVACNARAYGVAAAPPGRQGYQSVLSQVVGAVVGRGVAYHVTIALVIIVLMLSANTSFADFPRLCRLLADDRFLPAAFAHRGRRLVFTVGVLVLASFAGVLLVAFGGITDALIPLFAVGAFLAFTMSQSGMVVHWRRAIRSGARAPQAHAKLVMNAVGAAGTGATLLVIVASKLTEGAWISALLIACMIGGLSAYRRRLVRFERATTSDQPLDVRPMRSPRVIVPLRRWDHAACNALRFALTLSADVEAVQVLTGEELEHDLTPRWAKLVEEPARRAGRMPPRLVAVTSPYRERLSPVIHVVRKAAQKEPDRPIVVMVPEVVRPGSMRAIASPTTSVLKALLVLEGGPHVFVVSAPWYLRGAARSHRRRASSGSAPLGRQLMRLYDPRGRSG